MIGNILSNVPVGGLEHLKYKDCYWPAHGGFVNETRVRLVKKAVHEYFGYEFIGCGKDKGKPFAKQVLAYCLCVCAGLNTVETGKHIRGRHDIALYAINKVRRLCKENQQYREHVREIEDYVNDYLSKHGL